MDDITFGIYSGAISSTIAMMALEAIVPLIKKHVPLDNSRRILRFSPAYRLLVWLFSFVLLLGSYALLAKIPNTPVAMQTLALLLGIPFALYLPVWVRASEVELRHEGLSWRRPLLKTVVIPWQELESVHYSRCSKTWQATARAPNRKIKISTYMDGFQDFLDQAEAYIPQGLGD